MEENKFLISPPWRGAGVGWLKIYLFSSMQYYIKYLNFKLFITFTPFKSI